MMQFLNIAEPTEIQLAVDAKHNYSVILVVRSLFLVTYQHI